MIFLDNCTHNSVKPRKSEEVKRKEIKEVKGKPDKITELILTEAVAQRGSVKSVFLEFSQNSQENTCACARETLLKKRLWHQVFSCEFCEISKNTFFSEHFRTTASVLKTKAYLKKEPNNI